MRSIVFFLTCFFAASAFSQQQSKVVLPRAEDTLQANFYAMECSGDTCAIAASGYNWSTHTAKLFLEISTDRGDSWRRSELPLNPQRDELSERKPRAIAIEGSHVWMAGDSGLLILTTDLGQTWKNYSREDTRGIRFLKFFGANNGLALGVGGLGLITTDGGSTWDTLAGLESKSLYYWGKILNRDSILIWGQQLQMYVWSADRIVDTLCSIMQEPNNIFVVRKLVHKPTGEVLALAFHQQKLPAQDPPYVNYTYIGTSNSPKRSFETNYEDGSRISDPLDMSLLPSGEGTVVGLGYWMIRTSDWGETWYEDSLEVSIPYFKFERVEMISPSEALLHASTFAQGVIVKTRFGSSAVNSGGDRERLVTFVFPNPSSGEINIQKWYTYDDDVRVVNVLGEEALRTKINREPGTSTIDCSKLPNGTYTVLIKHKGQDLPIGRFILMK